MNHASQLVALLAETESALARVIKGCRAFRSDDEIIGLHYLGALFADSAAAFHAAATAAVVQCVWDAQVKAGELPDDPRLRVRAQAIGDQVKAAWRELRSLNERR